MVIYLGKQLHFAATVAFDDRIIQNKKFDTFRSDQVIKYGDNLYCEQRKKLFPVVGYLIQETEQILFLKY